MDEKVFWFFFSKKNNFKISSFLKKRSKKLLSILFLAMATQASAQPLRVAANVALQVLDPIASPSFITRNFAYMVYDTLVALDSTGEYRPQMLEGWTVSDDRLTYTFKLRPGLVFSDGTPVTAEDCVASLRRWGAKDSMGKRLIAATKDFRVVDASTFILELSRPFGLVIQALGKPSLQVPVIMPARFGDVPPNQAVKDIVGSGPFLFDAAKWVPGEITVLHRNPAYKPRDEPADGFAGGKVVTIDELQYLTMSDASMRVAALQRGEVDYLEATPFDYLPSLVADKNLTVSHAGGIAQIMGAISINRHQPPFDNVLVRQALEQVLDRNEILAGQGVPPELTKPDCASIFMCGTIYGTDAGTESIRSPSLDRARDLLRQVNYQKERVVFMLPADSLLINPIGLVVIDRMKKAGFNLDVQTSDWSSLASRWIKQAPLDQGGWSVLPVIYPGFDLAEPLSNPAIGYNCTGNQPWSYCNADMTPLIAQFEAEYDVQKRKQIAAKLQALATADGIFPVTGQFSNPAIWRANLSGVVDFGIPVFWNIRRR
jgi:peptide/nickel transport system substrate-binding protein